MPPRGRSATQQHDNDGAGPSSSGLTFPEYVPFAITQSVLAEGVIPEDEVKAMIRRLTNRTNDDAFALVLRKVQADVKFLDIGIERVKLPANKSWYLCAINKDADESSKLMGSKYNAEQIQYFKAVLEAIGKAAPPEEGLIAQVGRIALVNVDPLREPAGAGAAGEGGSQAAGAAARGGRKLSMVDKGELLKGFVQDGWLHEPRQGYYTMGPRTLSELKDYALSVLHPEVAEELQRDYM
ncbi:hypothetical protein Agub_g1661 [Astrephomene gubernaculifera]|uniref:Non-structural maintenance of chromosomes element 1 homolog n=1 Tax=Astrephomene gubernaculifera TaxID=47775 RepID=A0AAD3DJB1_9CHLO|nr:hypothetical protein Agub_g1661 [Astrephomene gubernaculifera]